jgi:hypothetical protein
VPKRICEDRPSADRAFVASGRLMWTARASTPSSSSDVNAQLADLSQSVLDAAGAARLF